MTALQGAHAENLHGKPVILSDGTEASISQYPANGEYLLLWLASGFGFNKNQKDMAGLLAKKGFETWMVDMAETLFLNRGSSALKEVPGKYVAEIITAAHKLTGKKVILMSASYGAIPALRGAFHWQQSKSTQPYLLGAILFSPNLYKTVPSLGNDPEYMPITSASNIPIYIFQGEKNGNRWQIGKLREQLSAGGSKVFVEIMRDITGIFYHEERTPVIKKVFVKIPDKISTVSRFFEGMPTPLANPNRLEAIKKVSKGLDISLKKFKGNPVPHTIALADSNGKTHHIKDYSGKITIVNFWATWCPPCREEIPSLNRLKQKLNDIPFNLVSIDYAENHEIINTFLKKVKVEFTVLLDTDGKVANKWKVIAFPSTFIIGPDGKIHYGVNAGLEWDTPEVESTIRNLYKNRLGKK